MKKAVIVVGAANAGKSTTCREFKKLVKMESERKFTLNGKWGHILSSSFEETNRDVEATVRRYSGYDYLVLVCQGAVLKDLHAALKNASFLAKDVRIKHPTEAREKAKEVLARLK